MVSNLHRNTNRYYIRCSALSSSANIVGTTSDPGNASSVLNEEANLDSDASTVQGFQFKVCFALWIPYTIGSIIFYCNSYSFIFLFSPMPETRYLSCFLTFLIVLKLFFLHIASPRPDSHGWMLKMIKGIKKLRTSCLLRGQQVCTFLPILTIFYVFASVRQLWNVIAVWLWSILWQSYTRIRILYEIETRSHNLNEYKRSSWIKASTVYANWVQYTFAFTAKKSEHQWAGWRNLRAVENKDFTRTRKYSLSRIGI